MTQELLTENFHVRDPNIWLPNSSGLNFLNYHEYRVIEKETNQYLHNNQDSFKATILVGWLVGWFSFFV